jgi:hypothetical protein
MDFGVRIVYRLKPSPGEALPTRDLSDCLYSDDRLVLGANRPSWYPLEWVQNGPLFLWVEGHLCGGWRRFLDDLGDASGGMDDEALVESLRARPGVDDGEATLLLYDARNKRMVVWGDHFARLPIYYHLSDEQVLVSRSQRFIMSRMGPAAVDPAALSQLLLLGYPVEHRTLVQRISRLLPDEFIVARPETGNVYRARSSVFQRSPARAPASFDQAVLSLRDEFLAACRSRSAGDYSHVLSLSGGIDSRTTGAGMRSVLDRFSAVTFVAPGSGHADERPIAESVASALRASWRSYELRHDDPANVDRIVQLKVGLNPVDLGFGIDYVEWVQREFGPRVALWTGEGADKLLCEHRAIPERPSSDQLVRFILQKNAILSPAHVSRLGNVAEDDLGEALHRTVTAFAGIEPRDAYVHFLLSQRVVRWHSEGEDRHRVSVWPISPFFGGGFVALARSISPRWKRGRLLYRAFLASLAPDIAAIPLWGHAAPSTRRFALEYGVRELARDSRFASRAYAGLRRWKQSRDRPDTPWHRRLASLLASGAIPECLDSGYLASLLSARALSPQAAAQVLTAVLAVNSLSAPHLDSTTNVRQAKDGSARRGYEGGRSTDG